MLKNKIWFTAFLGSRKDNPNVSGDFAVIKVEDIRAARKQILKKLNKTEKIFYEATNETVETQPAFKIAMGTAKEICSRYLDV